MLKRLEGYQLLKNPKGVSPYQVNMIKNTEMINFSLDRFSTYERISKDFTSGQTKTIRKHLSVKRFMFWTEKNKEVKKARFSYKTETGKPISVKEDTVPAEMLNNRNFDYINRKCRVRKGYDVNMNKAFLGAYKIREVPVRESICEDEVTKFFDNERKKAQKETPSFWKVLKSNLSMK